MLRSWHEEAKKHSSWKQLRLIVVYSTEIYVPLQLHQSPFNVGLPIQLDTFTPEQVMLLAQRYSLIIDSQDLEQIMNFLGGHPFLVHLSLYHVAIGQLTIKELVEGGQAIKNIYGDHLQRHWAVLEQQPELLSTLRQVISGEQPIVVQRFIAHKLYSMGLVKTQNQEIKPSCGLYKEYFQLL